MPRPTENPHHPTIAEWETRAKEAEALAWKRYKTIKKLRAEIRRLRGAPAQQDDLDPGDIGRQARDP